MIRLAYAPYRLKFYQTAITSRARMSEKSTWFLKVWDDADPACFGIGEMALFEGLGCDDIPEYESIGRNMILAVENGISPDLSAFPSIRFGLEQALLDFRNGGKRLYFPGDFTKGKKEIAINGLVWMGTFPEMKERMISKIEAGFRCVKLKIGAINRDDELNLIKWIRERYSPEEIEIRVDANGAFGADDVFPVLDRLAEYGIHSIEQPVKAGNYELMRKVIENSPVPVALDEELIGINSVQAKISLLESLRPQYIILKPSLCGGFSGSEEWIKLAGKYGVGWWVTSALESNVGLNALAQWVATLPVGMPQGLGTGALYSNNFTSPLHIEKDYLLYDPEQKIPASEFKRLEWIYVQK